MDTAKVAETLLAAADYMHEYGWAQFVYKTRDGRVCIVGALIEVCPVRDDFYIAAYDALTDYLGKGPVNFNQNLTHATGAVQAETALREAARRISS